MIKKFKMTCEEATTICNKNQYGEAKLIDKIRLNWHILTCKFCFLYAKQNTKLTKLYKGKAGECRGINHYLSNEEKELLKEKMNNLTA